MRLALLFALLLAAVPVAAQQIYRWVDATGTTHYSQDPPPAGVKAVPVPIRAEEGPPAPDTQDCYTVRCQGERMEQRIARRQESEARAAAERAAAAPKTVHGLTFSKYISIQRGMSEGELLGLAGEPDLNGHRRRGHHGADDGAGRPQPSGPRACGVFAENLYLPSDLGRSIHHYHFAGRRAGVGDRAHPEILSGNPLPRLTGTGAAATLTAPASPGRERPVRPAPKE